MRDWKEDFDPIGMAKAVNWELAKGYLRAAAAAGGQVPSSAERSPDWKLFDFAVEEFIMKVEDGGLHE